MNCLVVYGSQFGNTEKVAKAIAGSLGKGARAVRAEKAGPKDFDKIGLLVVGSPTQKWNAMPATKSFLKGAPKLNDVRVAAFDTRFKRTRILTGSAARKIAKALKKKGGTLVAEPESFFVGGMEGPLLEGEIERAKAWGKELAKKV